MKLLLQALSLLLVLILAVQAKKSKPGTCESITSKICSSSDVFHKLTSTPITVKDGPDGGDLKFNSQKKALRGTRPYVSLLRKKKACRKFLKPFVCAVHLPACDDSQMMRPIPPCKELCFQAMENCNEGFTDLGLEWPRELDCGLFPSSLEDHQCVSAYYVSQTDVELVGELTKVQVTCRYNAKPRMQPMWLKDGTPVEEISERMGTVAVDGHTTTLIIAGFTDSADAGVYTCVVENDNYGSSVNLDHIRSQGPVCQEMTIPCPEADKCISVFALCDGVRDCPSGVDEDKCSDDGPRPPQACERRHVPCPSGDKCVPFSALCDGVMDCPSGVDETNCTGGGPRPPQACEPRHVPCPSGDKCVPFSALCDGVMDCPSGVDETNCTGGEVIPNGMCPPRTIPCPMSEDICIPLMALCDGIKDCPNGMDEMMNCTDSGIGIATIPTPCLSSMLPCPSGDKCILTSAVCDGIPDCMSGVDEMNCTTVSADSCVPITIPECMVGLDYTTTIPNYPPGLSSSDKETLLSSLSVIFDSECGRYFRPFMCSAFLPPCRDRVVPPCRELCFLAVQKCLETFEGVLSEEDLMASGGATGSCDMMPSVADGQCYNMEVISFGEVMGIGSEAGVGKAVDCTYNLTPGVQPKWTDPSGNVVKTGSRRRVQVIYVSGTVTLLQIVNYSAARTGGTYTCSADGFSATVEL